MNLLAIESSTECCSVALGMGDQVLERHIVQARGHARLILPWVRELLDEASLGFTDLDALVVSRGPGSFTSLRIGLGIVQGISLAHDLPVHAVSSLEALAADTDELRQSSRLLALLDARMGEVYAAWYQGSFDRRQRIGEEALLAPDRLEIPDGETWQVTGPGARAYRDILVRHLGDRLEFVAEESWPRATALLALAGSVEAVPAYELEPAYLRDQVTG